MREVTRIKGMTMTGSEGHLKALKGIARVTTAGHKLDDETWHFLHLVFFISRVNHAIVTTNWQRLLAGL